MTMNGDMINNKPTFVLHTKYAEQVALLDDAQAGILFRAILKYANTGETVEIADPAVYMLFSFIRQQIDSDYEKYEQACKKRSEAASRAGKISAEKRALKKLQKQNATNVNEVQQVQHDNDSEYDSECDNDCDLNNISGDGGEDVVQAREIIYFADTPTVQAELDKFHSFAQELFVRYSHHQPGLYDLEQVFVNTYSRIELDEDTAIAVFDPDKAELLLYAFQQAANADKVTWGYINGIYQRFAQRGIKTVMDAERYNWELKHDALLSTKGAV